MIAEGWMNMTYNIEILHSHDWSDQSRLNWNQNDKKKKTMKLRLFVL